MGRAYRTFARDEKCIQNFGWKNLGDLGVDGRVVMYNEGNILMRQYIMCA
jgi:hypothetical protein